MKKLHPRKKAKDQGEKFYFTGRPCINGHLANRWTIDASCVVCRKEINRKSNKKNRLQYLLKLKIWLANNIEKNLEYKRKWKKENPIKIREYWHRKRAAEGQYTETDINKIFNDQFGECPGCQRQFSKDLKFTIDHIIPLSKNGTNWPNNIQLLCGSCNYSKGAKFMDEWLLYKAKKVA